MRNAHNHLKNYDEEEKKMHNQFDEAWRYVIYMQALIEMCVCVCVFCFSAHTKCSRRLTQLHLHSNDAFLRLRINIAALWYCAHSNDVYFIRTRKQLSVRFAS